MHPAVVVLLAAGATWGGWRWYLERVWVAPEEAVALAVTVLFLAAAGWARRSKLASAPPVPHLPMAILLAAYAASHLLLPPIMRAALAIAATLFALYQAALRERPPAAFWGLVALALPVLPSLQFVLGYPMRIVSAALSVALLNAQGLAVARQGTFLEWRGEMLQFDAPCSGVNMLWAALLLTLMGCVLLRFGVLKVMAAIALSAVLTIGCNVLRASSLFYIESGLVPHAPAWWHDAIGIAAFSLSAAVTLWLLRRWSPETVACAR
jgi:exosortase/archaeosortase family protein